MKYIGGDLVKLALEGEFDVVVHGCNCWCAWGAGIAKQMKSAFPLAYEEDMGTLKGRESKLGTFSAARDQGVFVVNAYTQYRYGQFRHGEHQHASYDAIDKAFRSLSMGPIYDNARSIGVPYIGAGLAGGEWKVIEQIIKANDPSDKITVVKYVP